MAQAAENGNNTKLKCKKCRETLLDKSEHIFREPQDSASLDEGNIFGVDDDSPPDWINSQIEQGGWTKGKLSCSKCGSRVGGFDFVSGHTPQIYIVKSKVDVSCPVPTVSIVEPRQQPELSNQTDARNDETSDLSPQDLDSSQSTDISSSDNSQGDEVTDIETVEETASTSSSSSSSSVSNHTDHESSSEDDLMSSHHLSRRQLDKIKRRKKRRRREKERANKLKESKVEEKVRELLEAEPELENLPDELICPVCLDLLFEPFQTEPCRHIFCEPCLRRLGQKNAMATKCPLCRARIRFCKHLAATSREIREQHEAIYLRRKKFERSTPVFSYPLPWTPGWRNLLRGRPLGGNTIFVDENNQAEYMRTVLLQIPYYIPPVFLANLFNILVFGFLLGIVELLPTVLYALMGLRSGGSGSGGGINLTDALSDVIEGVETSDNVATVEGGETTPGVEIVVEEEPVLDSSGTEEMSVEAEALDSTFYFILFFLSLLAAGAGQFIMNNGQGRHRFGHRLADTLVVICVTCFPLLIIPTFLPYRAPQGTYLGTVLKKIIGYAIDNISIHTAVLVLLVSLIYHFDVIDEMIA